MLNTSQKYPKIATEDIKVYKTCIIDYVNFNYSKIETNPLRKKRINILIKNRNYYETYTITSGVCAFTAIREGWVSVNTMWIIPKGAKYYNTKDVNIISNKLIFKKFIGKDKNVNPNTIKWNNKSLKNFLLKWKSKII